MGLKELPGEMGANTTSEDNHFVIGPDRVAFDQSLKLTRLLQIEVASEAQAESVKREEEDAKEKRIRELKDPKDPKDTGGTGKCPPTEENLGENKDSPGGHRGRCWDKINFPGDIESSARKLPSQRRVQCIP